MFWPFACHAELAAACAAFFLIGVIVAWVRRARSWPLLVLTCLWFAYAAWEHYCTVGKYNIRIDLLVLPWLLLIATIVCLVAIFVRLPRDEP